MAMVWLNGRFVEAEAARLSISERGFLLGDGAFETMRLEGGRLRRWARHRARLARALDVLEIAPPDWTGVQGAAIHLGAGQGEAVVRLTISRGPHGPGMTAPSGAEGTVLVTARARLSPPESVTLARIDAPRREPSSLVSRHKLTQYADLLHARRLALGAEADMALVLASDGSVSCADSASVFWIRGDQVFTPGAASAALPGTTLAALDQACEDAGIALKTAAVSAQDFAGVDAAFVANAVMGIVPVAALDGRRFNTAHPLLARLIEMERAAE
ncbi:MAG: aminotransferase class IV [Oceanicaulis sp.]|nr:aminotransferase class IV [Oceanicaulis sp.]